RLPPMSGWSACRYETMSGSSGMTEQRVACWYHRLMRRSKENQSQLPLPLHADAPVVSQAATPGPPAGDVIVVEGVSMAIRFVRHPRARRYVLRVSPSMEAVVTVPRRGSLREGRRF